MGRLGHFWPNADDVLVCSSAVAIEAVADISQTIALRLSLPLSPPLSPLQVQGNGERAKRALRQDLRVTRAALGSMQAFSWTTVTRHARSVQAVVCVAKCECGAGRQLCNPSRRCTMAHAQLLRKASMPRDLWIFGYGSLIWRPGFAYLRAISAA